MMTDPTLKRLVIYPEVLPEDGIVLARAFARDYPYRAKAGRGAQDLCIYAISGREGHYVYATKTSIVVRRDVR